MDDDDENLVDWGYDDEVDDSAPVSGQLEAEDDDILAGVDDDVPTQTDDSNTVGEFKATGASTSASSISRAASRQSPPRPAAAAGSRTRVPSSSARTNGHPSLPSKLAPSPRTSHAAPKPKDLPSRPSAPPSSSSQQQGRGLLAEPISTPVASAPSRSARSPTPDMSPLPPGWVVRHSNSRNKPYYYHEPTKTALWERPQTGTQPGRAAQEQEQDRRQQQPPKAAESSLASRIALDQPAQKIREPSRAAEPVARTEDRLSRPADRDPSPSSSSLLNRLGAFAPSSAPAEAPVDRAGSAASSSLRGRLSPPRGSVRSQARSRSPPSRRPAQAVDVAAERQRSDERERDRLREIEREKERQRGRALEAERLLAKQAGKRADAGYPRRPSPGPASAVGQRARSPPPHVSLGGRTGRREPSPGPFRRPISRSPPRRREPSPPPARYGRAVSPPSRWPKPASERAGADHARGSRPSSPPAPIRVWGQPRPPLDSRGSSSTADPGSRAPVEPDARRRASPPVAVERRRERSPPPPAKLPTGPRSQRPASPSRRTSAVGSAAEQAVDEERKVSVHPSRAILLQPTSSSPAETRSPHTAPAPPTGPSVVVPPQRHGGTGGRMPAGVDYNGKVDPNFAPLKATRKWGAPATPSEQPAPSPTTTSSTIDKPSSATPARPRSPPPTRAPPVALQADVSTVSSSGPPANAKRDWNVGDSYNPPSSEHDSRRDRPMFDPRPSMSRSRFELERERDRRYREAGPKSDILSADLPPEEPWESARIQQRLAHEAHLKRVADAKLQEEPKVEAKPAVPTPSPGPSSQAQEATLAAPKVHPSRAGLLSPVNPPPPSLTARISQGNGAADGSLERRISSSEAPNPLKRKPAPTQERDVLTDRQSDDYPIAISPPHPPRQRRRSVSPQPQQQAQQPRARSPPPHQQQQQQQQRQRARSPPPAQTQTRPPRSPPPHMINASQSQTQAKVQAQPEPRTASPALSLLERVSQAPAQAQGGPSNAVWPKRKGGGGAAGEAGEKMDVDSDGGGKGGGGGYKSGGPLPDNAFSGGGGGGGRGGSGGGGGGRRRGGGGRGRR